MKITRLRIRNFRSIENLDVRVPPAGINIAGANAIGKSNVLRAIKAALIGKGVAPEAIRTGAEDCEILIDTDDPRLASIRQLIRQDGDPQLTVKDAEKEKRSRARGRLTDIFGPQCLDSLEFYRAKPQDQRRMVLEASGSVAVTAQDLGRWTGSDGLPLAVDLSRNGLEVVSEVRKHYYDLRTAANRAVGEAEAAAAVADDEAKRLASDTHKGVIVPAPGEEDAPVLAAEKAREALAQRQQAAEAMAKRTEGTRATIKGLRRDADSIVSSESVILAPSDAEMSRSSNGVTAAEQKVRELRALLRVAEDDLAMAMAEERRIGLAISTAKTEQGRADELRRQADSLESTLAEAAIEPPTEQELEAAELKLGRARAHADLVRGARAYHDAQVRASALAAEAEVANAEADRLDTIVRTLTVDAPSELAARGNLIPGLTITDDGVLYQGRPIDDSMSGSERMRIAVEIAKRLNPKAGVLLVDEIGVLDDEHMKEFVRLCTADGWQLIATCMRNTKDDQGNPTREMVIEAFELGDAA